MTDTAPEIEEMVRKLMMARSGEERFQMGASMFDSARAMMRASMPPGLSELEQKCFIYKRTYGEDPPQGLLDLWESKLKTDSAP